jgi:hypothetical protein
VQRVQPVNLRAPWPRLGPDAFLNVLAVSLVSYSTPLTTPRPSLLLSPRVVLGRVACRYSRWVRSGGPGRA